MAATVQSKRAIPSVDRLLGDLEFAGLPRPVVTRRVREILKEIRRRGEVPHENRLLARLQEEVERLRRSRIQPVVNGTGIILHTNLGRAPLSAPALERLASAAGGYCNLEFDLASGRRGRRGEYVELCLASLCRAEGAVIVNNCAAALVLILKELTAKKKEAVISRGELIQIGGGFRIPEILEAAGATLKEVGTTNRTAVEDYAAALGPETGLILKVHPSNFSMSGFVESASLEALAPLAKSKRIPLVEDLGSGAMTDTEKLAGLRREPMPGESVKRGADLVCFSGDKLFGGPQAGIIVGTNRWTRRLRKNPLYRALRCDKLILSALESVVEHYLNGAESTDNAVLRLLRTDAAALNQRAHAIVELVKNPRIKMAIVRAHAQVGGGALPDSKLESPAIEIHPKGTSVEAVANALRNSIPPLIAQTHNARVRIHLRSVFPEQDEAIARALNELSQSTVKEPERDCVGRPVAAGQTRDRR